MKKRFFIYSLPRSGSSWLSQFLSLPGSYCYHDPLADMTWDGLEDRMLARSEPVVGAIDTSAHQRLSPATQGIQYYVIRRNIPEVLASLRLKGYTMNLEVEKQRLDAVAIEHKAIELHYKWFNDLVYLRNIWGSIVGSPFDEERAEFLMEMNIQRKFAAVKARLASCRTSE